LGGSSWKKGRIESFKQEVKGVAAAIEDLVLGSGKPQQEKSSDSVETTLSSSLPSHG